MEMPLMKKSNFVSYIGNKGSVVDSQYVAGPGQDDIEALSTAPIEFTVKVPPPKDPEQKKRKIKVVGPHGPFEVELPEDAQTGADLLYRLAPPPEYRIEVPPDGRPGSEARFKNQDGIEVSVIVPEGHGPGDFFEVTPPVHMVRVPDGVAAGAGVVFKLNRSPDVVGADGVCRQAQEWCRAVVPQGVPPGSYFPARLPPPPKMAKDLAMNPLE